MNKTIKQIADELGLKKHIVKYKVEKLSGEYLDKKNGVLYVNEEGQLIIKKLLGAESEEKSGEKLNNYSDKVEKDSPVLVANLLKEVEEKNKQIEKLHAMFEQQQKLLDQQQVLTLQANKKIEQLELKEEQTFEEDKNKQRTDFDYATSSEDKKSFWTRLFKS